MYASLDDISTWLREDIAPVNDANSQKANIDAGRIIRARLSGVFTPAVLISWADPSTTPELIRSIAGRLTAAYMYRKLLSGEQDAMSIYASQLWTEALGILDDIRIGDTEVLDDDGEPVDTTGANLISFYPDNTTQPIFSVNDKFS